MIYRCISRESIHVVRVWFEGVSENIETINLKMIDTIPKFFFAFFLKTSYFINK